MFDFEKLIAYQKISELNKDVLRFLFSSKLDLHLKDQWKRATISVALNIAEGVGRTSLAERKRFYTIARGSVFECVAILDLLNGQSQLNQGRYQRYYKGYEEISKLLLALFRS